MTNESARYTPEANQPVDKVRRFGALRNLSRRAINRAIGLIYGNEGSVMVQGPAVPVRIDANPQTRKHLFGDENPADYQPGPVPGQQEQGASSIASPTELGVPTSAPETADNLGVKPNITGQLPQYMDVYPDAGNAFAVQPEVSGPDAIGAQPINPDQTRIQPPQDGGVIRPQ